MSDDQSTLFARDQHIVLNNCWVCRGRRFYVEPDEGESLLLMGCYQCDNQVDLPISALDGFSLQCWKNPTERAQMFACLSPLYDHWNAANEQFDWRGTNQVLIVGTPL
ncbi:MAG: hypothetical protein EP334_07250 [Gammaproteobacteria bacterium]|nr:MAG: hypothetical protein EP334_07250 [Gammaproteobacteria bacterium]